MALQDKGEAPDRFASVAPQAMSAASSPARIAIRFDHVSKSYSRQAHRGLLRQRLIGFLKRTPAPTFRALNQITFELRQGDSLAVVGPNGAGKSTLLRLALGITAPDSGSVGVEGTSAALIELGAGFHPDLTGAENVMLNASLLGLTRKEAIAQYDSIVSFSGIAEFMEEPLRTYSNGMIMRLAFSIAVRVNPDILFIDELLAVGDQDFQRKCIDEIQRLKSAGKTLVCVSHSMDVLHELCERALWMEHGEIKMFDSAATVLDQYERTAG